MQEKTEEVSPEEIKSFMNEPEKVEPDFMEGGKPELPPPSPMMTEDWEGTPENAVANDFRLTSEQIAELAYGVLFGLDQRFNPSALPVFWYDLDPEMKRFYIGNVAFYINSAANPNGHEACQAMHDLILDAKLRDGWKWGEMYSELEKTDPMLLSYKGLPPHLKARNFLFRCVVVGLVAVWKGH